MKIFVVGLVAAVLTLCCLACDHDETRGVLEPPPPPTGPTKIAQILSDTSSTASYVDSNHQLDIPPPTGGAVREFQINGDTSGNDVGNCTRDDMYVNIYFNPTQLQLRLSTGSTQVVSFQAAPLLGLCPLHSDEQGDREFAGHGPAVEVAVRLWISADGREVWATVTLFARETAPDNTTAQSPPGGWNFKLYVVSD